MARGSSSRHSAGSDERFRNRRLPRASRIGADQSSRRQQQAVARFRAHRSERPRVSRQLASRAGFGGQLFLRQLSRPVLPAESGVGQLAGRTGFQETCNSSASRSTRKTTRRRFCKDYAARFDANPKQWTFLTGDLKKILDLGEQRLMLPLAERSHSELAVALDKQFNGPRLFPSDRSRRCHADPHPTASAAEGMTNVEFPNPRRRRAEARTNGRLALLRTAGSQMSSFCAFVIRPSSLTPAPDPLHCFPRSIRWRPSTPA